MHNPSSRSRDKFYYRPRSVFAETTKWCWCCNFCLVQYKETWRLWCHSVFAVRDVTFIPLLRGEGHTGNRLLLPPVQYTFLPEIWCSLLTWLSQRSLVSPLFQRNPICIPARRMFVVFLGPSMRIPRCTFIPQLLPRLPFFPLFSHYSVILSVTWVFECSVSTLAENKITHKLITAKVPSSATI
jgi:hypothetical protein